MLLAIGYRLCASPVSRQAAKTDFKQKLAKLTGPVGLACAASCHLLGAAAVIVSDLNKERLDQARSFGCETVDISSKISLAERIEQILGSPEVDCAVDCVGFEARGHGADAKKEAPATVLNSLMQLTRAGGSIGIPGLYVTRTPAVWMRQQRSEHSRFA